MWLAVLYILGSLFASAASDSCPEMSEDAASLVRLKPLGDCGDEETTCPYRITLPALSIQLPRPFRELEKMAKELQNLKDVVNRLRRDCQECKERQSTKWNGRMEHREQEEVKAQSPRRNVSITERQSHIPSGEQVVRIITSTIPRGDTPESEGTIKSAMKKLNHSDLEKQGWSIDSKTDVDQDITVQTSETSREVKIFNPSLAETPQDISEIYHTPLPEETERDVKSQRGEFLIPSLSGKNYDVQPTPHGKQQPSILREGNIKNTSGILTVRRRVQSVADSNGLTSISRDPNTKTIDLSSSAVNRRVTNFPGVGGPLRMKTFISNKGTKVSHEDRLRNSTVVRRPIPQAGNRTIRTGPNGKGFSPVRSVIMRVKETSLHSVDPRPGSNSGIRPSADHHENKTNQDMSRVSDSRIDNRSNLQDVSHLITVAVENSRELNQTFRMNKTEITRVPINLRKEDEGEVSQFMTNKSNSSVMERADEPNTVKVVNEHVGLQSPLVISSKAGTSPREDEADSSSPGRQVENEQYLNPVKETEIIAGQRDLKSQVLNGAIRNEREPNPSNPDPKEQRQSGTYTDHEETNAANKEVNFNSLNAQTVRKEILSNGKATLVGTDLVSSTLVPTLKNKSADSTVSKTNTAESPLVVQGSRRISIPNSLSTPRTKGGEKVLSILSLGSKSNISRIQELSRNNTRSVKNITRVVLNLPKRPNRHPAVLPPRGPKPRQPNMMDKMSRNSSVLVPSRMSTSGGRNNSTGVMKSRYIRKKPNFQTEPTSKSPNRGFKTKVSTMTQLVSPTGAPATIEDHKEETKNIPLERTTNVLDNHHFKIISTESKTKSDRVSQNTDDGQDVNVVKHSQSQVGEHENTSNEKVLTNMMNSTENHNKVDFKDSQNSETSNSRTGGKENKQLSLGTVDTSSETPTAVDKIHIGKKEPKSQTSGSTSDSDLELVKFKTTSTKGLSELNETTQFTTSNDARESFMDTGSEERTKNIPVTLSKTHIEIVRNVSQNTASTPISFENTRTITELELIKLNEDRAEENSGDIMSNPNSVANVQGNNGERDTNPVVLDSFTNVEEIKGSTLFSLSPEDTAEGFKVNAVSDEIVEKVSGDNKLFSTCLSECDSIPTNEAQTRPAFDSKREKGSTQDCTDYITTTQKNGIYRVTPRSKNSTFHVFCDMESSGGGWTLIQHRFDGSMSFNRTWDEYKGGFGKLTGEFWLGNDKIHWLTKAKNMTLRIELEDFEGVREYAHYNHFYVANESQQYRLSIGGYSGTAGNAMQFNYKYNHDQKLFTTPDRDNDLYPSGNCGAYYSSGWWFDACMSANLNGKYYHTKYKGLRNGIFWGTWHNITMEYYPTNDRQSFKMVRMMIRPKTYAN